MVINISIHDSVKKLFISQCFQQNYINTFDVLTFIQMRTVLTNNKFTSGNNYTYKNVSNVVNKKICAWILKPEFSIERVY